MNRNVLVTDFDGTMTRHDFYKLVVESLLPPGTPDYWAEYRAGQITHFEGLRRYFAAIQATEAEVLSIVDGMELEPELPEMIAELRRVGWEIIVTSAGCDWYIRRLLGKVGVEIEVHSNPGRFVEGQGLLMDLPKNSRYLSPTLGVDKAAVVRQHLSEGRKVAFAGDGFPDAEAARLAPAELRFARDDLAYVLREERLAFHSFERWSDIARTIVQGGY